MAGCSRTWWSRRWKKGLGTCRPHRHQGVAPPAWRHSTAYSTLSLDMELSKADDSPTFADTLATTDRSYGVILDREAAKCVSPGSSVNNPAGQYT